MSLSSPRRLADSPSAHDRVLEAGIWLASQATLDRLLVVTPGIHAGESLLRDVALVRGGVFGARVLTLAQAAGGVVRTSLVREGLVTPSARTLVSVAARVIHELHREGALGRFSPMVRAPGFARSIFGTLDAHRLAGLDADAIEDETVGLVLRRYVLALQSEGFADRAEVFRRAVAELDAIPSGPLLLLDVHVRAGCEADFVGALARQATSTLALSPTGDESSIETLSETLRTPSLSIPARSRTPLRRLQARLGSSSTEAPPRGDAVVVLSGADEEKEAVEVVRQLIVQAERGVRFDEMAILMREPERYRAPVEEAMRRARIPVWFAGGVRRPNPSGRAFLSLLACAADGLSASAFDEYLSLGESPASLDARPDPGFFVVEDAEFRSFSMPDGERSLEATGANRHWERLIAEARVIAGAERWPRRLRMLRESLLREEDEFRKHSTEIPERFDRDLTALDALERLVLPLIERLGALPRQGTWGEWLRHLRLLALHGLRRPEPVLVVLSEFAPLGPVGSVGLDEVRRALVERLLVRTTPDGRPEGRVFVGSIDQARGHTFEIVALPGYAGEIDSEEPRTLRLAAGAAARGIVLSFPRQDAAGRSLLPSSGALELLRAANGGDVDSVALVRWAAGNEPSNSGLPAPRSRAQAIDDTEHDLALLNTFFGRPDDEIRGLGRALLELNPHLGRALRFRARRSLRRWTPADGLVDPTPEGLKALSVEDFTARAWSSTALQLYAGCPYRFYLSAIARLRPREKPERIEDLDPMQYGAFVHEVQFEMLTALRDAGLLPLRPDVMAAAERHLDLSVERVASRYADELAPTVARVWNDTVHHIRTDLVEWLRRLALETEWVPWRFELSFGLDNRIGRDEQSHDRPVQLPGDLRLRGSIDLVERRSDGALRATDHKTGRKRTKARAVIEGGDTLQPVLYALALEQLFPDAHVASGRLDYCTSQGGFGHAEIALDDKAREAAELVAVTIGESVRKGFLPAYPIEERLCGRCDYLAVCGPNEWVRVQRKPKDRVAPLLRLRAFR